MQVRPSGGGDRAEPSSPPPGTSFA